MTEQAKMMGNDVNIVTGVTQLKLIKVINYINVYSVGYKCLIRRIVL